MVDTLKGLPELQLSRDDLKAMLSPPPLTMHESAIEAYEDARENGRARPQAIDILRAYLRRAYRLGAAETLSKLVQRGDIAMNLHDHATLLEIIHNRGTTVQKTEKKRG